jgi:ABC-type branched-subunit amino acid transport system ATPase component
MNNGQKIAGGLAEEVMENEAVKSAYLGAEAD